jgi:hypothetical protein
MLLRNHSPELFAPNISHLYIPKKRNSEAGLWVEAKQIMYGPGDSAVLVAYLDGVEWESVLNCTRSRMADASEPAPLTGIGAELHEVSGRCRTGIGRI